MTLAQRILIMVIPQLFNVQYQNVSGKVYVKIPFTRTNNYVKFRNWWNKKLQNRIIKKDDYKKYLSSNSILLISNYDFKLGALSKNTKDMLTVYFIPTVSLIEGDERN